MVKLLIENGANLNTINQSNNSALILAISEGIRWLLFVWNKFLQTTHYPYFRIRQNCRDAHSEGSPS